MRRIGFSTGALARGDFARALEQLRAARVPVVELSALRIEELIPLMASLHDLELDGFSFVSVHAPSRFEPNMEAFVIDSLTEAVRLGYPVVVHPDVMYTPARWALLENRLVIENMDKRKPIGRNVEEMQPLFDVLPSARFCFDIGHARQVDPSMTEAALLLRAFGHVLTEVHISEVNTSSRHDPISRNAVSAFSVVAPYIPEDVPIVLETLIDDGQSNIETEIGRAREALTGRALSVALPSGRSPRVERQAQLRFET
jgi:hypothetical protein